MLGMTSPEKHIFPEIVPVSSTATAVSLDWMMVALGEWIVSWVLATFSVSSVPRRGAQAVVNTPNKMIAVDQIFFMGYECLVK